MKNEVKICRRCGSENLKKMGKQLNVMKTTWKQKWFCKDCKLRFTEKKQHLMNDYYEAPFTYLPKGSEPINWSNYNQAQINEKRLLLDLAKELIDMIEIKQIQRTGRPSDNMKDIVYAMLLKAYTGLSSRRLISDLEIAKNLHYIEKVPCYSTLMNYFNDTRLRTLLRELVELSAMPLAQVEEDGSFSTDSSGFSTSKFGRWFDYKFNEEKERREYKKAHIMIGNKTNVVTAVTITDSHGADAPQLPYLVKKTAMNFNVKEVCADKAYSSRNNLEAIFEVGAFPFIPFKSNTRGVHNGAIWRHMYRYFKERPQDFNEHYHKRSNVETSFFMIKQKFDSNLMTKNDLANVNEILCKLIAHNLCCLIHAFYEFNLHRTLWTEQTNIPKIQVLA